MANEQTTIYIELEPELQQLLVENGISIDEILREQNIEATTSYGIPPEQPETDVQTKEPVTIILASAAAAIAIGIAISNVLNTLQRKPQLVEYYELVVIKDAEGNPLVDKKGNPQVKRVKKIEMLEPRKQDNWQQFQAGFDKLLIKFTSKNKQS